MALKESAVKLCPECFQEKYLLEFDINSRNLHEFEDICRECKLRIRRKNYKDKAEHFRNQSRNLYSKNKKDALIRAASSNLKTDRFYVRPHGRFWIVKDETDLDFKIFFVTVDQAQDYCDLLNHE